MQTPCDTPVEYINDKGKLVTEYRCPYKKTYTGFESEMCRNMCGEGVDEDSYPEDDYPESIEDFYQNTDAAYFALSGNPMDV